MRKKLAKTIFMVSLIGILVQMYYNFFVIDSIAVYGPGAMAMPIMIILFAVFLIWYANYCIKKNRAWGFKIRVVSFTNPSIPASEKI